MPAYRVPGPYCAIERPLFIDSGTLKSCLGDSLGIPIDIMSPSDIACRVASILELEPPTRFIVGVEWLELAERLRPWLTNARSSSVARGTLDLQALYRQVVVAVARRYLGVREEKGRANRGSDVDRFQSNVGIAKEQLGASWCAAFVYTVHSEAASLLGGFTSCPNTAAASYMWYKSAGVNTRYTADQVYAGSSVCLPGDLFVFEEELTTEAAVSDKREKRVEAAKQAYERAIASIKKRMDAAADKAAKKSKTEPVHPTDKQVEESDAGKKAAATRDREIATADREQDDATKQLESGSKLNNHLAQDDQEFFPSHTGIVENFDTDPIRLYTIEGNTNAAGSREGDGVYTKDDRLYWKLDSPPRLLVGKTKRVVAGPSKARKSLPRLYGFVRPQFFVLAN